MKLSIIIPARNEEKIIIETIKALKTKVKFPHEIVVVNDGSTDRTKEVVSSYSKRYKNVRVISTEPQARGFANALMLGFKTARKGAVVPVMADLCDDPAIINLMFKKIQEGWDVVCGSRYMKGGHKDGGPRLQGFLSWLVCRSLKVLTEVPTQDVSNAFKMYKKEILEELIINPNSGVEASMEILLQAYFNGAKITEMPTLWKGRTIGNSKFKVLERAPKYLKIYLWAVENSIKKRIGMRQKEFYVK